VGCLGDVGADDGTADELEEVVVANTDDLLAVRAASSAAAVTVDVLLPLPDVPSSLSRLARRAYNAGVLVAYPLLVPCPAKLARSRRPPGPPPIRFRLGFISLLGTPKSCAAGRDPRRARSEGGMGATDGRCGKSRDVRLEVGGDWVWRWGYTGGLARGTPPEVVDAEWRMAGRCPAAGNVVMVLQVLERYVAGGEGRVEVDGSTGLREAATMDPRRWVMPRARLWRRGEPSGFARPEEEGPPWMDEALAAPGGRG